MQKNTFILLAIIFVAVALLPAKPSNPIDTLKQYGVVKFDYNERADLTYLNYYPVNVADTIHVQNDLNIYRSKGFRVFVFE